MVGLELAKFYSELGQVSDTFYYYFNQYLIGNTTYSTKKCIVCKNFYTFIIGNFRENAFFKKVMTKNPLKKILDSNIFDSLVLVFFLNILNVFRSKKL